MTNDPKKYARTKYLTAIAGFLIKVGLLLYWIGSGLTFAFRDFATQATQAKFIEVLVYLLIVGTIFKIVDIPLSFYSGYIVEHRFGLSRQTLWGWTKDLLKGTVLGALFGIAAVEVVYDLLRRFPEWWWVYAGATFAVFLVILANLAPVLLMPLFFKFKPVEDENLKDRLVGLARRAGTKIIGIFEWSLGEKTRKANAAVVGWGNTRRIIISDTLLENFSSGEIEVILAHELAHHVKNHLWMGMAVQSVLTFVGFYAANWVLVRLSERLGFHGISDIANFPLLVLVSGAVSLVVLPVVNYFSRRLEREADLYALDATGNPQAFISSMEKLASLNLADKSPNKIVEFIFYSHPSFERRILNAKARRRGGASSGSPHFCV